MEYIPFTQQFGNLLDYALRSKNAAQQAAFSRGLQDGTALGQRLRPGLLSDESQQVLAETAANPPQSGRDVIDQATISNAKDTATTYTAQKQAASDVQQAANNATQAGANAARLASGLLPAPAATQAGMSVGQEIFRNDYANAIEKYKNDYAWASAHGDQDGMKAASEKAAYLRQQAPSLGINPKDLGENLDLAQMQAQGQVQRMSLLNRVLNNTPTPDEYYQQQFNKYRDSGVSTRNARALARDDAANYQAHYMADMARSFYATGLTPENAVNQTGAQILQLMRGVDSDSIALPNAYFAKPVNDYTYIRGEQARDAALARQKNWGAYNEGLQKDMLNAKTDSQSRILGEQFNYNRQLQNDKLDYDKWKTQYAGALQREAMAARAAAGGGNRGSGGGGSSGSGKGGSTRTSGDIAIIKLRDDWNKDNPGMEWANPYQDAGENATDDLNGRNNVDIDNSDSVYSWATAVCEENARRGYPASEDELVQAISSIGGYGPQVAEQLKAEGRLGAGPDGYGRNDG